MPNSVFRFHSSLFTLLVVALLSSCNSSSGNKTLEDNTSGDLKAESPLTVDTVNTWNNAKRELTKDYCEENYGTRNYRLDTPRMIVVHYTVIPTLAETLALFKRDSISPGRKTIGKFSKLNVGIHYVIDKDGKIYKLDPDSIIARHVIGFNYVSLGIENIAKDETELTNDQLESNVRLIRYLTSKYSTIKFLIGHSEYNDSTLAHYQLFKSMNPDYKPYDKSDPGPDFMRNIRSALKERYNLVFEK